jgi:methyl-accepting chemotaxis protein
MSFPISITWQVAAPPTAAFDSLASSAAKLDSSMLGTAANFDKFGQAVSQAESPLGGVATSMQGLEGSAQSLEGTLGGAAGSMGEFAGSTEQLNGAISETGGFITEASGSMGELSGATGETGSAMTELSGTTTETGSAMTELQTSSTETGTSMTDLGTATTGTNTVLTETNDVLTSTAPVMAETATGTADLAQGFTDLAPPVEASQSALSDTVPVLEGAGTAATDASTATDDYTGALGGMGDALGPVQGGLDASNTVMEDLGTSTDTTATNSDTLNGSLTTLGTGFGAVSGAALTLYGAYTNIRDAQAAVEKAQTKVIDANKKAETSYNSLNRIINKIVADTENGIQGQERLAKAQAKLNALWDAGVRSGPAFAAALAELRAANDALSSSTVKGTETIAKLGPAISGVESSSRKASASQLGLTRANEGLNASFLETGGAIISGVSGIVQIGSAATKARPAFDTLKGSLSAVGTAMSGSLIPALGAIAVPAAIAIAAIGAFIGAVEAIRANIGVFDELGVAIGNTFPPLRGFLDDARQAFINFSDGLNTGISMLLGAFDSLTGGVFGAQKAWDGFTGSLPKGTGEMGLAAHAANLWTLSMDKSGNVIRVGAGKWKEADGVLMRLNGSVLAAAGTWDQLGDGTAVYLKTAEKVPPVTDAASESTTKMSEATKKAADELAGIGTQVDEANAKIVFYSDANKMAELTLQSFALGIATAKVELIDETAKLAEGAGALQEHGNQMANGTIQALAYKQGILEAGEALVEKVKALEQAKGAYDATNVLMQEGTLLATEYATGLQETKTAVQDAALELVNLAGQLAAYNDEATAAQAIANAFTEGLLKQREAAIKAALGYAEALGAIVELQQELQSAAAAQIRFNEGLAEGQKKALEWQTGIAEARGEAIGFRAAVVQAGQDVGMSMQEMASTSTEQIQLIVEAFNGMPSAIDKVVSGLDKMGQKVVDSLTKASKDGATNFMENIDKLEQELHTKFAEPVKQELLLIAQVEQAKKDVEGGLAVLATLLRNKPLEVAIRSEAAQAQIEALRQKIAALPPEVQKGLGPLQAGLDGIAQWQPGNGLPTLAGHLAEVLVGSQNLEGGMQGAITSFNGLFQSVASGAGGLEALKTALAGVGLTLDTTTGQITTAAGQIVADLGTIGPAATAGAAQTVTALDTLGPAGTAARTTLAFELVGLQFLMDSFAQEVKQSAIEVSTAFANMATNTNTSLQTLASGVLIMIAAFPRMASAAQSMATTVSGAFSNMATNTNASLNRMASGLQIMIAAFPRLSQEAQKTNTTVSNAMSQMSSKVASFASAFTSAMSKVSSAAASATSKVNALQSAINALKSKTITITTIMRTVHQTVYAAHGAAFVTGTPTNIGGAKVSEFGQKELVTVTPLEGPGRQKTGIGKEISDQIEEKTKRKVGEERGREQERGGPAQIRLLKELPIIIQIDGKEITRAVNRRIFEVTDGMT